MTRENKIGLLVGLAFIIAVGILFSDYLSVNNEPPQASLQVAGSAIRSSLGESTATDSVAGPSVVRVPNRIAPVGEVPTAAELAARARRPVAPVVPPVAPIVTNTDPAPVQALATGPNDPNAVPPALNKSLIDAAHKLGEELVAPSPTVDVVPAPAPRHAAARTVEAESGDTLGDLADRAYGSNTKATRAALVAANPSLQANRNLIVAGRAYDVAPVEAAADEPATPAARAAAPVAKPATLAMYTVRPGDTLWSIANDEVGNPNAVAAIRDLNHLQGDRLRLNMRLKLPKRKAAVAE
jgi:nucleoid-associated protein YgaU